MQLGYFIDKVIGVEIPISCPWFGGTIDAILVINGATYIIDFKTSKKISSEYLVQVAAYMWLVNNGFASNTVGGSSGGNNYNRLPASPVTGQEYELVISENINGNVRWFVNGTLVQNGTTTLFDLLCLSNTESPNRFIGSYSLIEIYNGYCNDYTEFTNMVN